MKKILIVILIIFASFASNSQNINWSQYSFGKLCCLNAVTINYIFNSNQGNVYLIVFGQIGTLTSSNDNGNSWKYIVNIPEYNVTSGCALSDGRIIVSTFGFPSNSNNCFISDDVVDSLKSWIQIKNGLISDVPIKMFAVDSSNNIFAATAIKNTDYSIKSSQIFYLSNGDTNWVLRSTGLPDSIEVTDLIALGNNIVLSGSSSRGVFRSTDNGEIWTKVESDEISWEIYSFLLNQRGDVFAATDKGIFISKDKGKSWIVTEKGISNLNIVSLAVNKENHLYGLTKNWEIYRSIDDGKTWNAESHPIFVNSSPLGIYHEIAINSDDFLFVTNANSIYFSSKSLTEVNDKKLRIPFSFILNQNYPNPFNPTTSIEYRVVSREKVTLRIYDILGNEVSTLVNEEKPAGEYKVEWNAEGLPSGVYVYRITAGNFNQSRKMILMK